MTATATSFPLSKHTVGGVATPAFSSLLVYSRGKCPFPPLQWSHFYKLSHSNIAAGGFSLLPSQAGLFIYSSVRGCPSPPLWRSGHPALFVMCLFLLFLFIIQLVFFLFFPWVGVSLSRGLCWSGPGLFVGVPHAT
jgi:hypothetical protein